MKDIPMKPKAWDIVTLKDHTSLYRVYSSGNEFMYACLTADIWFSSQHVEVETIEYDYVFTIDIYPDE